MRKICLLMLFAAVVAAIVSCRDDGRARGVLRLADRLMEERPDSSLALLRRDSLLFEDAGRGVRMAYVLLRTEAEDKCYVTHTSDSAMLPAAKYFAAHGTPLQSVRAWYVLGRVYCDLRLYGTPSPRLTTPSPSTPAATPPLAATSRAHARGRVTCMRRKTFTTKLCAITSGHTSTLASRTCPRWRCTRCVT